MKMQDVNDEYTLSPNTLSTGLIASYPLISNVEDTSVNNLDGTASNITYTPGRFGINAATFNGSSSFVNIDSVKTLFNNSSMSVSCWVKSTNFIGQQYIISKNTIGGYYTPNSFHIVTQPTTGVIAAVVIPNPYVNNIYIYTSSVVPTKWTHIVLTSAVPSVPKIYINGRFIATLPLTANTSPSGTQNSMYIGKDDSNRYLNGQLKDVRIYNRLLNKEEIWALFKQKPEDTL